MILLFIQSSSDFFVHFFNILSRLPYGLPTKYGWAVEKRWIVSIVHYSKINYSNNKLYA